MYLKNHLQRIFFLMMSFINSISDSIKYGIVLSVTQIPVCKILQLERNGWVWKASAYFSSCLTVLLKKQAKA